MTKTIQELRAMDAEIATRIFGWREFREEEYPHRMLWDEGEDGSRVWDEQCHYCTDPADSFALLKKCAERVKSVQKTKCQHYKIEIWHADTIDEWCVMQSENEDCSGQAETIELAIAEFSLKLFP